VNTPTTHGSIGLTTGLDPAMTLGCGGFGGNITSDNISPRHLLNIKRLAYELRPLAHAPASGADARPADLRARVDQYLQGRGFEPAPSTSASSPARPASAALPTRPAAPSPPAVEKPSSFVCEDDVRQAVREGRTILISDRTIVTPAARDLGEAQRVFRTAGVSASAR
jgi:hypothetical protein